jgi:hypothetical protein
LHDGKLLAALAGAAGWPVVARTQHPTGCAGSAQQPDGGRIDVLMTSKDDRDIQTVAKEASAR